METQRRCKETYAQTADRNPAKARTLQARESVKFYSHSVTLPAKKQIRDVLAMLSAPKQQEIDHLTIKLVVGLIALSLAPLTSFFANSYITSISASYYEGGWSQSIGVSSFQCGLDRLPAPFRVCTTRPRPGSEGCRSRNKIDQG